MFIYLPDNIFQIANNQLAIWNMLSGSKDVTGKQKQEILMKGF